MAAKVTRGQICDGSVSKNSYHKEYYLFGKFHNCITKCTKCPFFLYYAAPLVGDHKGVGVAHKVTPKLASIFPDENEAILVR